MAKLGGSATIMGVDFEAWFVALKFVDAFFDENLKITPQAQFFKNPTTQKLEDISIDDVYIHSSSKTEYYNIKSHAPNMRSWTVNSLYDQKVITQFKNQFIKSPDDFLYFVTKSPCPIFYEVLPRGASCTSREELELSLSKTFLEEWNKIQIKLGFSDDNMISFAKQVKYKHIIDNEEIKKNIKYRLQGHVTSCPFVPDCLYQLAIEAGISSKTIKRDDVIDFLKKNNIHLKSRLKIEELLEKIHSASANLYSIRHKIENIHIEREEVNTLVNWIHTPLKAEESPIAVLTGKAGCGKTVIQRDLFLKIQRENISVLGIKADLLMFDSIEALSNEIGLSGGIVAAMATLVEKYEKGVVIFDQIDALSFTLGKDRKSINTYFNLINQLSDIKGIRIILSCRSFDLKYDPILKSLEHKYTVDVKELSDQQVDKVLIKLGIERKKISNRLLDLLRTPLHLKIFRDIYCPDTDFNSINTLHNLYNELYNQKILNDINGDLQKDVFKALDIMIDKMDNSKVLTVPFSLLERNSQGINYLSSQSIVIRYNNKIQFFHSTFFDYCYARTFLLRHDSLIKIVLGQHQGLFIRPQVKQVLAYLRDSDFSTYLKELKGFLTNHKVRFHICLLVINQLAFLQDPKDEEWLIVKQLLEKDDNFKKHFINAIQSEKWLRYLISSGYLQTFLQSGDDKIINLIIGKLRILINFHTNTIVNFLQQFPNIRKKDEYIVQVLIGLEHWEDEKAIRLFQDHLQVIKSEYSFNYSHFLLRILEYNPEAVCKIFFNDIFEKINAVTPVNEFDRNQFISHYDIDIFKKLLNWNSDVVLTNSLQLICTMIDKTKWKSKTDFFLDSSFYLYEQFKPDLYPHWQVLSLVLEKLKELAINDKSKFTKLVKGFEKSHSFTLLKIVLHGYNANSELYIEEGFKLFCRKGILENVTSNLEAGFKLRSLIRNIYPHFSKTQKEKINKLVLSVSPYWEKDRKKGQPSLIGHTRYELLNAIPDDEISKYPIMKKEFQELERKFGKFKEKPIQTGRGKSVGTPLPRTAYEEMTPEQWLSSFKKYDESTGWGMPKEEFLKGGIIEHSRAFTEQVSKRPDEFYDFVFGLGRRDDVSITYLGAGLEGLIKGDYDIEKIKKLVKTYWSYKDTEFRKDIIRAIEYIDRKVNLDLDLIEILAEYALNDPDPKEELWETDAYNGTPYYGGDPHAYGINTVRGSATERLVIHGFETQFPDKIFEILNKIAEDKSVAVRCCLIRYLQGMIKWNKNKTYKLFKKTSSDKHPQVIKYGLECLYYLMNKNNFRSFIFYLERAMILKDSFDNNSLGELIGQILAVAYLRSYSNSKDLLEKGYQVSEEIKIGAIECSSRHLSCSNTKIADKSKKIYMRFFHEANDKISLRYDLCFLDIKVEDFNKIYSLILEYSKTEIVKKHCAHFFEFLAKAVSIEPEKCINILQNYKNFESPEIRYNDLQGKLVQILIEAYNRVIDDIYKEKAMNVFDAVLQIGVYTREALEVLAEQDRG